MPNRKDVPRRFTIRFKNSVFYANGKAYILEPEWALKNIREWGKPSRRKVKYCKRLVWRRVPKLDSRSVASG